MDVLAGYMTYTQYSRLEKAILDDPSDETRRASRPSAKISSSIPSMATISRASASTCRASRSTNA